VALRSEHPAIIIHVSFNHMSQYLVLSDKIISSSKWDYLMGGNSEVLRYFSSQLSMSVALVKLKYPKSM